MLPINPINNPELQKAVTLLQSGKLVAFPTETVYGLGADAENPAAVAKIFAAKGRPADHPVIVHLENIDQLTQWAREIPEAAWLLAKNFWPGPLTLILPKQEKVSTLITGGQDSVGLRIPNHPTALALLQAFGKGIAAPSANRFGYLSPTTAAHIQEDLGAKVDLILTGEHCSVGIESTIVDVSTSQVRILRPGAITAQQISRVIDQPVEYLTHSSTRTSGMLAKHYSPRTQLRIINTPDLQQTAQAFLAKNLPVIILARHSATFTNKQLQWYTMPPDPVNYAHELYAVLHKADSENPSIILVETVPADEKWVAICDRLKKAAIKE